MTNSVSQIIHPDGRQEISFRVVDSSPTSALITWEEEKVIKPIEEENTDKDDDAEKPEKEPDKVIIVPRSMIVPLQYDGTFYRLIALIPANVFYIKLDTETIAKRYEGDWGEGVASEVVPLELYWGDSGSALIPYCDLRVLQVRLFTQTMIPLEFVGNGKKGWYANGVEIRSNYGGTTMVSVIGGISNFQVKEKDGVNWNRLDQIPGGYYVEFFNVQQITTDPAVNATICRDELYGKTYGRMIDN